MAKTGERFLHWIWPPSSGPRPFHKVGTIVGNNPLDGLSWATTQTWVPEDPHAAIVTTHYAATDELATWSYVFPRANVEYSLYDIGSDRHLLRIATHLRGSTEGLALFHPTGVYRAIYAADDPYRHNPKLHQLAEVIRDLLRKGGTF